MKEMLTRENVLEEIAKSTLYGNLGLFLGSGFSIGVMNQLWESPALNWSELLISVAFEYDINFEKDIVNQNPGASYPRMVTILTKNIAEKKRISFEDASLDLKQKIADKTSWIPDKNTRKEYGELILKIDPKWIITTNFDLVIESLIFTKGESISAENQIFIAAEGKIPIYHLHGIRTIPNSIIISDEDYIKLFRPNNYRQLKLPLLIKESTTLLIGYSLNDINVLTALDWSKNVYQQSSKNYPNNIYQFLYVSEASNVRQDPYIDHNGIILVEFTELKTILKELGETIKKVKHDRDKDDEKLNDLIKKISEMSDQTIFDLLKNDKLRLDLFEILFSLETSPDTLLFVLYQKLMDEAWRLASIDNAFYAYNYNLKIHLDIFKFSYKISISPVLLEMFAYNLNKLASYIGKRKGDSYEADSTWNSRKHEIPNDILMELFRISDSMNFYNLNKLLKPLVKDKSTNSKT